MSFYAYLAVCACVPVCVRVIVHVLVNRFVPFLNLVKNIRSFYPLLFFSLLLLLSSLVLLSLSLGFYAVSSPCVLPPWLRFQ